MDQNKLSNVDLIILKYLYEHIEANALILQEALSCYSYNVSLSELKLVLSALIDQKLIIRLVKDKAEVFAINVAKADMKNSYTHFILNNYSALLNILNTAKLKFADKEVKEIIKRIEIMKNKPI